MAPHQPEEQRPEDLPRGVSRNRRRSGHLVVPRLDGQLRRALRRHHPARRAARHAAHPGHRDRQGPLHHRSRHPRLPQGDRHRRGARAAALPGRGPARKRDQDTERHLPRGGRLQGRRPAAQFAGIHPDHHRAAHLQGGRPGRRQHRRHRRGAAHRRRDGGLRAAHPHAHGRRAPLRRDGRERPLDLEHHRAGAQHDGGLRRHQPLRLDHRTGDAARGHRRREQHHARHGNRAHGRIRHPQGPRGTARVDHPADPHRIGPDYGHLRIHGHGPRRRGHGGGQPPHHAGPGRRRRPDDLPQPDAQPLGGRQRHGGARRRGSRRGVCPRLPLPPCTFST